MRKLDVYLRSIEKFGAAGAVITSGQAVTLKFATGDRHATQVTPHEHVIQVVREVAPPPVLEQLDKSRAARFELDSAGHRYALTVSPRGTTWQVAIEALSGMSPLPVPRPSTSSGGVPPAETTFDRPPYEGEVIGTVLEQLTRGARAAQATDIYLSAGTVAVQRVAGELVSTGTGVIDGDAIARELGVVAPPEARAAWRESGTAMFTYGDGAGRVRVTLARDHRGPSASLRLLPSEPPTLAQLKLSGVESWIRGDGLIVVAGPSGSGKTVTLGALIRALGERRRRVVTIEDPIELVHASAWISQRAVGEHVDSVSTAVQSAMNEGADAIVVGRVTSEATAWGVVEAVSGGHLVLTTVVAPVAGVALDRMISHLAQDQRELAHGLLFSALLGTIQPGVGKTGDRTFEVTARQP